MNNIIITIDGSLSAENHGENPERGNCWTRSRITRPNRPMSQVKRWFRLGPAVRPVLAAGSDGLLTCLSLAILSCGQLITGASTVWTGPPISFSKAAGADPTQASNQDRLTSKVWITRGSSQGLYNAATETGFTHFLSPSDTEWANGTTANYHSLTYTDWNTWAKVSNGSPGSTVGKQAVLHLKSDDIYIDIKFTSWGGAGSGGAFSYTRSTPSVGNQPPVVAITAPAGGATFLFPANVLIQATANDSDGSVTNVQFFDGTTSLGNVSSSPYQLSISPPLGSHMLTAVASDDLGVTNTSAVVTINVINDSPPSVSITNPTDGSALIGPATVIIQADANDSDGSVTNVEFLDGSTSLGNVSSSPYQLSISPGFGSHSLTAVGSDNFGIATTSAPVTLTIISDSVPVVSITNPIDGTTLIGPATVNIQASANDADGSVTNVQFFDGTAILGNVSSSPFELSTILNIGPHTLTAVASDNFGATTTSAAVTVNVVNNSPPSVSITNPVDGVTLLGPTSVTIQAAATDADGSVTNVQFLDGPNSLGNVSSSPFELTTTLGLGSHTLTAIASDNLGAATTSASVTVSVVPNSPPQIAITTPANGTFFTAPATVTIQVAASDADGTVSQVQFFRDSNLLGVLTSAPYALTVSNLAAGSYTLSVIATDNLNTMATNSVAVTVTNLPATKVTIANAVLTPQGVSFSFDTQSGFTYVAQFAPVLDPTAWLTFTNVAGSGSIVHVTDVAPTNSVRFYRIGVH